MAHGSDPRGSDRIRRSANAFFPAVHENGTGVFVVLAERYNRGIQLLETLIDGLCHDFGVMWLTGGSAAPRLQTVDEVVTGFQAMGGSDPALG